MSIITTGKWQLAIGDYAHAVNAGRQDRKHVCDSCLPRVDGRPWCGILLRPLGLRRTGQEFTPSTNSLRLRSGSTTGQASEYGFRGRPFDALRICDGLGARTAVGRPVSCFRMTPAPMRGDPLVYFFVGAGIVVLARSTEMPRDWNHLKRSLPAAMLRTATESWAV